MEVEAQGDPEFMTSLARGLSVLRCFADQQRPMTIAQASRLTGLSRPSVRRCLHTLVRLGYATQDGSSYALRPKTLSLGFAYLSSSSLAMRAQPMLDSLRDRLGESCSLGVLDEAEVYYVARAETTRIMSISLRVGSRLPLYATSMGRVLLAAMPGAERKTYLHSVNMQKFTDRTETSPATLMAYIDKVQEDGFAIVDQELELGLRSLAVPVRGAQGQVIAALNIGTHAQRVPAAKLRSQYLPELRRVAQDISLLGLDR
ncbi:IclR family transcriptional regulator domain-containing protein [Sphingobium sp.]|uniref:IclR family transcriptional regulator domain-containing protein n=1 Tax=Sphingobium sp. TaxID=1912891 RepID=UPI003B3AA2E7